MPPSLALIEVLGFQHKKASLLARLWELHQVVRSRWVPKSNGVLSLTVQTLSELDVVKSLLPTCKLVVVLIAGTVDESEETNEICVWLSGNVPFSLTNVVTDVRLFVGKSIPLVVVVDSTLSGDDQALSKKQAEFVSQQLQSLCTFSCIGYKEDLLPFTTSFSQCVEEVLFNQSPTAGKVSVLCQGAIPQLPSDFAATKKENHNATTSPTILSQNDPVFDVGSGKGAASTSSRHSSAQDAVGPGPSSLRDAASSASGSSRPLEQGQQWDFSALQPQWNLPESKSIPSAMPITASTAMTPSDDKTRNKIREQLGKHQLCLEAFDSQVVTFYRVQSLATKQDLGRELLPQEYWCACCETTVSGDKNWKQHQTSVAHLRRSQLSFLVDYHCNTCDADISGETNLLQHITGAKHRKKAETTTHRCLVCGQQITGDTQYAAHRRTHN